VRDPFPEWEWWKDDAVKRELGLTDKVSADIDSFYQRRLREVTPFVDEWRKQSDQLNQMTQERKVDESTFAVQVARVEALSSRLRESRAVMLYHIYLKLTPEQFSKLPDIRMRHFQRGRGGSPR
jgi:Spy/CpxP family protein refolding chaperone